MIPDPVPGRPKCFLHELVLKLRSKELPQRILLFRGELVRTMLEQQLRRTIMAQSFSFGDLVLCQALRHTDCMWCIHGHRPAPQEQRLEPWPALQLRPRQICSHA